MKRNIIIIIIVFIVTILLINIKFVINDEYKEIDENNTIEEENIADSEEKEVDTLMKQYNITGDSEIYKIDTESDGRKVLNVKPSVNFKVAFAGMIKNSIPLFEELDTIFEKDSPTQKGLWIKEENREKIVEYLNNSEDLNCKYETDVEGYLRIKEIHNANEYDQKIEKILNSENQYIINISSVSYMVDVVTGEIVDNPYNELDMYQTYDYYKDENRMIIFITENKESKMTEKEIFESVIELIELEFTD